MTNFSKESYCLGGTVDTVAAQTLQGTNNYSFGLDNTPIHINCLVS